MLTPALCKISPKDIFQMSLINYENGIVFSIVYYYAPHT